VSEHLRDPSEEVTIHAAIVRPTHPHTLINPKMAGRKLLGTSSSPHDIKKASYYVWFLGAKESKGLRGEEYITPVVRYLISKEKEQTPIKVTLQLSNKGLKIIQNVSGKRIHENYRENIKHFIPHHAITCTVREDDIVSCILLIYNPATACPVHVHSYRCDSPETAELLHEQLQVLVDRPENQKKFLEIESRLAEKGLLQRNASSAGSSKLGSDGRSLGRGSDSGAGSDKGSQLNPSDKIATMYDSLAAELREKLGGNQPILLPPRDYDTVHRSKGNILGIEERKSLNPNIVGAASGHSAERGRNEMREDSSGKSSGIGSDEGQQSPVHHSHDLINEDGDGQSSSDDEWPDEARNPHMSPDSLMLIQGSANWPNEDFGNATQQALSNRFLQPRSRSGSSPPIKAEQNRKGFRDAERSLSPEGADNPKERFAGAKQLFMSLERKKEKDRKQSQSPKRNSKDTQSPQRNAQRVKENLLKQDVSDVNKTRWVNSGDIRQSSELQERQLEGQARWSRYEKEEGRPEERWPKSDKDTGYVSRYSRDKSRSRDFEESPPSSRPNMFVKSGKKSSSDNKDKFQSKKLSRFLSRETLESDGYDHIEEFEEVEKPRVKVKRNPSRTSLKLDYKRTTSKDSGKGDEGEISPDPPSVPRRNFLRREVTELDLKGYKNSKTNMEGFSKKYSGARPAQAGASQALWALPGLSRERALSPVRNRFAGEERYPAPVTKVLSPEYRKESKSALRAVLSGGGPPGPDNRYPSLDYRSDKRKSLFDGNGEVMRRNHYPEPNTDYRRRSYHELSDIDKLEHASPRNFQHSGRKVSAEPIGLLPSRISRVENSKSYKQLPEKQRYPGLDRETARNHTTVMQAGPAPSQPFKNTVYHPSNGMHVGVGSRGSRSHDHPGARPAMFRHSYAEPHVNPSGFARVSPVPTGGRFGITSMKPFQ